MSQVRHPPHDVVRTAARWSRWVLAGALAAALGPAVAVASVPASVPVVVAAVGLLAGIPHGAIDHLLAGRLAQGRSPVLVVVGYAATAALAWALLQWAGPLALAVVLLLSLVHFGLGEVDIHRRTGGWAPGVPVAFALATASCGALLLPLARSGDELSRVAAAISPGLAEVIAADRFRLGLAGIWILAAAVAVIAALRAGRPAVAGDILLVGAVGAVLPPLAAFAIWFGGWHAVRHTGRLLTLEPACAALVAASRPGAALRRLARLAALPTAAATAVVVALALTTAAAPDPTTALAETLQILLALTVPHMLVVAWLDHQDQDPRNERHSRRNLSDESAVRARTGGQAAADAFSARVRRLSGTSKRGPYVVTNSSARATKPATPPA